MLRRDRLDALDFRRSPRSSTSTPAPTPAAAASPAPGDASNASSAAGRDVRPRWLSRFESALGGQRLDSPEGPRHVAHRVHDAREEYGGRSLASFLAADKTAVGWLGRDPALAQVSLDQVAFVDCETTGLAGGTGTTAFLVGIAYFRPIADTAKADSSIAETLVSESNVEPGAALGAPRDRSRLFELCVEQHFLPDYDAEPALLAGVSESLNRAAALVTFNGKSFDLPLLETRFLLARRRADWLDLPHLDLVHPARRVWKRRLETCALTSLEEHVLGLGRVADTPGWLIPSLYFDFLRTGNLAPLVPVFEHNRRDLLSLAVLAARLAGLVAGDEEPDHPLDRYSLGRLLEDAGQVERGIVCYERALAELAASHSTGASIEKGMEARAEIQTRLGLLYKRLRQDEHALATWERVTQQTGDRSLFALVELAKHYEHRTKDYRQAADVTRRALRQLALRPERAAGSEETVETLERRLSRLELRLRHRPGVGFA